MANAALRPAATASMTVAAPVTTSPPAKTPSTSVSPVVSVTRMVFQRVSSITSPGGRKSGMRPPSSSSTFVDCPMAAKM